MTLRTAILAAVIFAAVTTTTTGLTAAVVRPYPGFSVRMLDLADESIVIQSVEHAQALLAGSGLEDIVVENDRLVHLPAIDLAGGSGTFPVNLPYPADYGQHPRPILLQASAELIIPDGVWAIGFGATGGGSLRLEGINFRGKLGRAAEVASAANELRAEPAADFGWSVGRFNVSGKQAARIDAQLFDNSGDGAFELAIWQPVSSKFGSTFGSSDRAGSLGWHVLYDDLQDWQVSTESVPTVYVGGRDRIGVQYLPVTIDAEHAAAELDRVGAYHVQFARSTHDQLVVLRADPDALPTVLIADRAVIWPKLAEPLQPGDTFDVIQADQIEGEPVFLHGGWKWDSSELARTGRVTFLGDGSDRHEGDFNGDGKLDARDIDELSVAIQLGSYDHSYDLDGNGRLEWNDHRIWVNDLAKTWFGDVDFDGEMDTHDLVLVFQVGEYEDRLVNNSGWADGDWDGNGEFDTADFVAEFQSRDCYCRGPRAAAEVPESGNVSFLVLAGLMALTRGALRCPRQSPDG